MSEGTAERPRRTWDPEAQSAYDPAPTRPVLRSELEQETGWFPEDRGRAHHPPPEPDADRALPRHTAADDEPARPERDAGVVDLAAMRQNRANGPRRAPRPRRINSGSGEGSAGVQGTDPDSPRPDGSPQR